MILDAAKGIVETGGAPDLSAREIARRIGYAAGTLYNVFANLDDILLRVEAELFEQLDTALAGAVDGGNQTDAIRRFAVGYAEFAYQHARLWHLVQANQPAGGFAGPDSYLEKLYAPMTRLEWALLKITNERDAEAAARTARVLWSAIHGIVQVATTPKFGSLPLATARSLVEDLVANYLAGLSARAAAANDADEAPVRSARSTQRTG